MTDNALQNSPQPQTSGSPLMPKDIDQAMRLAEMMSQGALVPQHLQKAPADCLMVVEQAARWRMSPFAVAQATSSIRGKLMFEGKLVAAVVHNSGLLSKRLNYEFEGDGQSRAVVVSGTLRGEEQPRTVRVALSDVATDNGMWKSQPDQQLCYSGARVWARRHAPEVMLGVYTPEEMPEQEPARAERNVSPAPQPPAALPHYPQESFEKNFDSWANAIEAGKKTPDQIIAMISSKGQLTYDQCEQIRALAPQTEEA